jgi:hypothetical protein
MNASLKITLTLVALASGPAIAAAQAGEEVTIWKTPNCGCCEAYAEYLRENGFAVTVKPTLALVPMSVDAGVPGNLIGCHLAMIDGYAVSGHVPVEVIDRLLADRPAVQGITLPGMPDGSPGMTGTKREAFTIFSFDDGETAVYAVE